MTVQRARSHHATSQNPQDSLESKAVILLARADGAGICDAATRTFGAVYTDKPGQPPCATVGLHAERISRRNELLSNLVIKACRKIVLARAALGPHRQVLFGPPLKQIRQPSPGFIQTSSRPPLARNRSRIRPRSPNSPPAAKAAQVL